MTTFLLKCLFASGNIGGVVLCQKTHSKLAGVNIQIDNTQFGAATDIEGDFLITDIEPGSYNLRVSYIGYKTILKSNVVVKPGRTTILQIEMEEDILEGEVIEATASYFDKPKEAVVSTRSMDFEEIRRDPGTAMDIQRVMQALPAVVSGSDQNNEIIIRGGIPGENLFLLDGIEIPNPNHFGDQGAGGGPINILNTYMIRKVDFYAGAFSAKYGDKASSVMDIIHRDGSTEKFMAEGNLGMAGAGILVEGPISSIDGNYLFSARKSFLDLIISSTGLTAVPKYYNIQGRISAKLNPYNTLIFNGVYGVDEINIEEEGTGGYSRGAENVDYGGDQIATGFALETVWSNYLFSRTVLSTVQQNWDIDVYRTRDKKTYFLNHSTESEHTIKTDMIYNPVDNFEINFGGSYKIVDFDHDMWSKADTIFWYTGTQIDSIYRTYPEWTDKNKKSSYKSALYAQLSYDALKKIRLTGGLRYDYFDYNDFQSISPRLGMSYLFTPKMSLNFSYGLHYQSPSFVELAANPKNKNLKNKFTRQYVVGIEKIFREDIKVTLEAYYKTYHDVPIHRSRTTLDPDDDYAGELINAGKGYAKGIEFFLQKKLTDQFSTIISYSHSISQAKDLRFNKYYDWDFDFRNVFTFIAGYRAKLNKKDWYKKLKEQLWYKLTAWLLPLGDEVEFGFRYRYLGGRPYTARLYRPQYRNWRSNETELLNQVRYPYYSRFDFRLDRRFFFDNWNMVVYFDIMNVFDRDNIWEYQYNDDGTIEEVLQFQTFPVGGVSLEF